MISIRDEDKGRLENVIKLLRTPGRTQRGLIARQAIDEVTIILAHIEELQQETPYSPAKVVSKG